MSGTIYGVNTQTYHHLPPEDQQAIRDGYIARNVDLTPEPQPAPDVEQARTPAEAVQALHELPVPTADDLYGLPADQRQVTYMQRVAVFNATRAEAAEAALERFKPQREDFASLNGATASYEYQQALNAYNSSPYVAELQRIVAEAQANPDQIPAYLAGSSGTTDTQQLMPEQVRGALAMVGVELPANPSPEQLDAARQLLATLPESMLAQMINPGSQVSYSTGLGAGTPNLVGPSLQYNVGMEGQVELGDVQTGVNFEQTQQFEMYVQVQGGTAFDISRSLPQDIYKWSGRMERLPDSVRGTLGRLPGFDRLDSTLRQARGLVDDVPALRRVLKGLPVSGSYTSFEGARLSYEAVVTPEQGSRLAEGQLEAMPNPLDPLNMPPGTSILMRGQSLEGTAFELNYKAFTIGGTHTELSGLGFGVTRGEGSIVEVYSGPVETVQNSAFLGLGRQDSLAIGIGSETKMESRQMQIARIDLSTPEGQAAYQTFISTGRVPEWSPPGVQQSGTTEVFSHEYARFIGLRVGGFEIGGADDANGAITRTTWADGTVEYSNTYTSAGGVTTDVRYQLDASGNPDYDNATWTVVRADLDPTLANYLESAYDPSRANQFPGNAQHTQQVFTTAELMELRDRAREYVVQMQGQEKLDNLDSGLETPWWSNQEEALAIAKTPEEVFAVLGNDFHGGAVIESLLGMSRDGTIPGQFRMIDAG